MLNNDSVTPSSNNNALLNRIMSKYINKNARTKVRASLTDSNALHPRNYAIQNTSIGHRITLATIDSSIILTLLEYDIKSIALIIR